MRVYNVFDPDSGLVAVMKDLLKDGVRSNSRAGPVLTFPEEVSVVFEEPEAMISRWYARDANPFFHYFESWWMLAGRSDATWLDKFVHDFSARFAEDDGRCWGAYGKRWRSHFSCDQLQLTISKLRENPDDRRVVIQMWSVHSDFNVLPKKDHPCNLMIVPRIVQGRLNFTIYNRSNDIIWGTFGANAVHFPMMQQWMAKQLDLGVGTMTLVSSNMHGYENTLGNILVRARGNLDSVPGSSEKSHTFSVAPISLNEMEDTVASYDNIGPDTESHVSYAIREFQYMALMWKTWKQDKELYTTHMNSAWLTAGMRWIERRMK
jgi:thymidylate synthase